LADVINTLLRLFLVWSTSVLFAAKKLLTVVQYFPGQPSPLWLAARRPSSIEECAFAID
jgi:hypothetical protein